MLTAATDQLSLPVPAPSILGYRHRNARELVKMPFRIAQTLLDTSFYLYPDEVSANEAQRIGGSGFVAGLPLAGPVGAHTLWAITNRHVIESGHWTIRLNNRDGKTICVDTNEQEWFYHPEGDDLAVRPLAVPGMAKVNFVPLEMMLTKQMAEIFDIGPGDAAFVIGRFVSMDGRQRNTPSVRFGQISQIPDEKLKYDKYEQEAWLVEVKSLNGYSGSPVFCYLDPAYYRTSLKPIAGPNPALGNAYDHKGKIIGQGAFDCGPYLLGVDCCMVPIWQKVCDSTGQENQAGMQVPLNTGMMGVIPAWRLIDMMMNNPVKPFIEQSARGQLEGGQDAIPTHWPRGV